VSLLRVSVFPGGFNWPSFAAVETGIFARENIQIELQATMGSVAQMTALAAGEFDIAMTAFDNVVAYVEGQGEAPIGPQPEFFAFLGSDDSFLSLVGKPHIGSAADLRACKVSVDAATTGYAFALIDLLAKSGLHAGDYTVKRVGGMAQRFHDLCTNDTAATLLSTPYDIMAEKAGLRVIMRLPVPYQGNVGAARRDWARRNGDAVSAFIRAYVTAVNWLYDAENKPLACAILQQNVSGMNPEVAGASYLRMLDSERGFFRDGRLCTDGMRRVLDLRSRYIKMSRAPDPANYISEEYWRLAFEAGA
jgi:ABC-type nitrate/sulfonate/bicarbonate transport system substrate-binding protein